MSAADEIEDFLAESKAADPSAEAIDHEIEAIMRKLSTSDDAITIDACDEICAVIRRKELKLHERWIRLLPILWRVRDQLASGKRHRNCLSQKRVRWACVVPLLL